MVDTKENKTSRHDDLISIIQKLLCSIEWKNVLFLFLIYSFILSDLFVDKFLTLFNDSVNGDIPNTKGSLIQVIFMIVAYVILDLLNKKKVL